MFFINEVNLHKTFCRECVLVVWLHHQIRSLFFSILFPKRLIETVLICSHISSPSLPSTVHLTLNAKFLTFDVIGTIICVLRFSLSTSGDIIITFISKYRRQKTLGKTHLFFFSYLHNNGHCCIFYYMRRFAFMNGIYSGLSY